MSLRVMSWVLDESPAKLGPRLVLLVLAEYAHDDGSKAFPSVATIQRKARMSERGTRDALRKLEGDGLIRCVGATKSGTRIYTVIGPFNAEDLDAVGGAAESAPGRMQRERGQNAAQGRLDSAPDPGTDPPDPSLSAADAPPPGFQPREVAGAAVTRAEATLASALLAYFNERAETKFRSAEYLRGIVGRIREFSDVNEAEHRRVIDHVLSARGKDKWWRDPAPNIVYGNSRTFDRSLHNLRRSGNNGGDDAGADYGDGSTPLDDE